MKKVLYITFESLEHDPILHSQVIKLVKQLNRDYSIDIITFDSSHYIKQRSSSQNHIFFERRNYLLSIFSLTIWLIKNGNNYNLIHVRSYLPMFAVTISRLFINNSVIFDMRGVMAHEFLLRSKSSTLILKKISYYLSFLIFLLFEKLFINVCDAIVVVSRPFCTYVQKWNFRHAPVHVIPTFSERKSNLIDSHPSFCFFNETFNVFVYSGSMDVWQQFPKVLELFIKIYQYNTNSRLLILTTQVEKATKLTQEVLPSDSYYITKAKSSEINNILSKCDYGILLRDNSLVNRVAAPIKFTEYIASGIKVIITNNIGDASEHVNTNKLGLVLKDLKPTTINNFVKDNIITLKDKEKLPPHKIKTLLDSTYSLEIATSKYKALYKSLV